MFNMGKMTTGERIRYYRRMAGYSLDEAAEKLNLNKMTIINWENDKGMQSFQKGFELTKMLGVTAEQLLGDKDPDPYEDDRYMNKLDISLEIGFSEYRVNRYIKQGEKEIRTRIGKCNEKFYNVGDVVTYIFLHAKNL